MNSARGSFNLDDSKRDDWDPNTRGSFRLMSFAFDPTEADDKIEGK